MKIFTLGLLVVVGIFAIHTDANASVAGDAECELTLKIENGKYYVTNISSVSRSMTYASCKQRYEEVGGLSIGDLLAVDQSIKADIDGVVTADAEQIRIPISFTSAMGVGGVFYGVRYHTDTATMIVASQQMGIGSENEVDVAVQEEVETRIKDEDDVEPTVADDQPPTTYRDSMLYGWWRRILSWFGW